ncbi:E3 ubiquitin-protein ligase RNF181 homolog isoform X3 [Scaptodrosophila lebanonensis]|uniref:RING-type E3 ubiquitin transferase n=1 Tax=Drosophila lebanonensis TaxID=7225 RepID=A0A6J2T463_DROLE|nr:E3 ubiquitin-protein ligase RNF181 homolog isoform X3 [Scaptodrosophila lebanonensis]
MCSASEIIVANGQQHGNHHPYLVPGLCQLVFNRFCRGLLWCGYGGDDDCKGKTATNGCITAVNKSVYSKMADYFEELGHEPTGPEGANDFARHFRRLQVLAIMNGIDMEIEVPEASKKAIAELPVHKIAAEEFSDELECAVCKQPAEAGESYKILPCKHEFHEECILLWLKKANSCPLCRYELETDDTVYEELRRFKQDENNRRERQNTLMDSMFG